MKKLFIIAALSCTFSAFAQKHEMVDLGLSVKWATCNVDADAPEIPGGYYSWGEVETKSDYTYKTYKWAKGSDRKFTKYCDNPEFGFEGFVDNKKVLDPEDDVATVKWGDGWRMPTAAELAELQSKCKWEYLPYKGIACYKITGKNGNCIYLPMAGNMSSSQPGPKPNRYGEGATYNSSSLSAKKLPNGARGAYMYSGAVSGVDLRRAGGRMVRPVHE